MDITEIIFIICFLIICILTFIVWWIIGKNWKKWIREVARVIREEAL